MKSLKINMKKTKRESESLHCKLSRNLKKKFTLVCKKKNRSMQAVIVELVRYYVRHSIKKLNQKLTQEMQEINEIGEMK